MQPSKSASVRITLLPLLLLIFTGTVHILITFDPVLVDVHFTSYWLLGVAQVLQLSHWFLSLIYLSQL